MTQARYTHSQFACPRTESLTQTKLHFKASLFDPGPIPLHLRHTIRRGRLVHILQHPAEERFVLLLADAQTRLRHEIAERQWRR
jgi:hypothetical protein